MGKIAMRPVERGATPLDPDGTPIAFGHYRDARDALIDRIGDYCSYCENVLPSKVDVEHVLPKVHHPELECEWTNFLLACDYCNPVKSDTDIVLDDFFWPDRDNTARAFAYEKDLAPRVADRLSGKHRAAAQSTLELTGLDREPSHQKYRPRDRRWIKRREAWGVALESLRDLRANDTEAMRRAIVRTAISRGFFSIWMQVFEQDTDMRLRFIKCFQGTAPDCFDRSTRSVQRPGGRI
jgi:hypothetical protein